ncbi:Zn-dependent hydrolase, partial [Leptolyngbya sp. FACHB-711]|nr:Zn-dependent hydrolase [Leptolyngbya sp. FACHB-711]
LNPKIVIPTQYRTQAADAANCDILPIDNFLNLVQGATVRRVGSDSVTLRSGNLPAEGTEIQVLSYAF